MSELYPSDSETEEINNELNDLDYSQYSPIDTNNDLEYSQYQPSNNLDYSQYQSNINRPWKIAPKEIVLDIEVLPLIYYPYLDIIPNLENSNKIILPQKILDKISEYENVNYPLHFTINSSELMFTPFDFKEDITHAYIPQRIFNNLMLELNGHINLTLINEPLKKGTKVILKPHTSNFLEIVDHKTFLEQCLVKNFTTLTENQTICVTYFDSDIEIDVIKCEPNKIISIVDTDLEVDFEQPYDYKEPPKSEIPKAEIPKNEELYQPGGNIKMRFNRNIPTNVEKKEDDKKEFVPFSGKGYRLGDK